MIPDQHVTEQRRQELLEDPLSPPKLSAETLHTLHFVIRVLKSWPRMLATSDFTLLPPMIHHLQLEHGIPTPLANCSTLVRMWAEHVEGSHRLVQTSISQEVQRLFHEV